MFSVDNFYTFMNTHYGLESDGRNVLYLFRPHGSKNWNDLIPGFLTQEDHKRKYIHESKGVILLHDQEPFDRQLLDIYRVEKSRDNKWRYYQTTEETLLQNNFLTIGWPMLCHSEWNSDDIKWAEESGVITCYYFYHGLIARDWFRHWKHHGAISSIKDWQHRFLLYARDCTGSRQYRESLIDDLIPLKSMINYDWDKNRNVNSNYSAKISVDDAQSSAIHLVAETIFCQEKIHLTEKIFKPMVMMQPFILFGGARSLEYLRKYGFQTFGEIWDESYDLEPDHKHRYQMIKSLIKDLSLLSDAQITALLLKCQKIVEHNQRHFFSDQFEEMLLDELKSNIQIGLDRQDKKVQRYPGGSCLYIFDNLIQRGIELPSERSERLKDILNYLKTTDQSRLNAICQQHPWLLARGFV
jgi:hypothetical protein